MKRLSRIALGLSAAFAIASCQDVSIPDAQAPEPAGNLVEIVLDATSARTRTATDEEGEVVLWKEGESVSIWDGKANREFKTLAAGTSVQIGGSVDEGASTLYGLYPYSPTTTFTASGSTVTASTVVPTVQEAVAGTLADGLNMTAADTADKNAIGFKNLLAAAKLTLSGPYLDGHRIKRIELESTSHALAGNVSVTYGQEGISAVAAAGASKTVTLRHEDGSVLADGTYYIMVLPNAGGQVTLRFYDDRGMVATKTATLSKAFEAGVNKNLGTVKGLSWENVSNQVSDVCNQEDNTPASLEGVTVMALTTTGFVVFDGTTAIYVYTSSEPGVSTGDIVNVSGTKKTYDGLPEITNPTVSPTGETVTVSYPGSYPEPEDITGTVDSYSSSSMEFVNATGKLSKSGSNYIISIDGAQWQVRASYPVDGLGLSGLVGKEVTLTGYYSGNYVASNYKAKYIIGVDVKENTEPGVSTLAASSVGSNSATLNASFSNIDASAQTIGFYYGTVSDAEGLIANGTFAAYDGTVSGSGNFSVGISSLEEETTYHFIAYMQVYDSGTGRYEEVYGSVVSFTTAAWQEPGTSNWLEMPRVDPLSGNQKFYTLRGTLDGKDARNYSAFYDPAYFAQMWTAYPLCKAHSGSLSRPGNWSWNPLFSDALQVDLRNSSYGVSFSTEYYSNNLYARGHMIPNADRNGCEDMQLQTFYCTNSCPQIQNGFNGGVWEDLEEATRGLLSSASDTVYVVTGPVYRTVGGNETVKYITSQTRSERVAVPNYYFKVLLKVKRNSSGTVTGASAIGFWFEHKDYGKSADFSSSSILRSINEIEEATGYDFFVNLPSSLEAGAENNSSWTDFKAF